MRTVLRPRGIDGNNPATPLKAATRGSIDRFSKHSVNAVEDTAAVQSESISL